MNVKEIYNQHCFYEVLTLIRDAWDGDAESFRSKVFTALCRFVVQYRGEYDRHRLVSRLRMAGPIDIYDGGRNVSNAELPGELKYIYQVLKIYNGTNGVDLVTTANELGHANATTTAMIYAHQIAIAKARAADVRAGVFAGRDSKPKGSKLRSKFRGA